VKSVIVEFSYGVSIMP